MKQLEPFLMAVIVIVATAAVTAVYHVKMNWEDTVESQREAYIDTMKLQQSVIKRAE